MSEIGEGIGGAIEGGLFARAMEPDSGAKARHPHQPDNCLNCDTPLVGAYCHACGQSGHLHRTIGGFLHDLVHGAFHFEGKFWRTLPMLILRPGRLTRRYIEGARARFVSPMALFLFSIFLLFAVFQVLGITPPSDLGAGSADRTEVVAGIDDGSTAQDGDEAPQPETYQLGEDSSARMTVSPTGIGWIDEGVFKKWRDNPSLMLYKLQANSYKFSWLLIPLSIPFVWLLFAWKRRYKAYDHAIFVTYSLSFMTLLFITVSVLGAVRVSPPLLALGLVLIPPIHLYKQLRGAYELSRFSAFWRLLVLSLFIWIVGIIFLQVLLLLGAF